MNSFEQIKRRMPHFFSGVDVLEYSFHEKSKSAINLFSDCRYIVIDPRRNNLDNIPNNSFNTVLSVNTFQNLPDYIDRFNELYRVSSKFILFSCAAPGSSILKSNHSLTEADFVFDINFKSMFDSFKFSVDYDTTTLFFWGVKSVSEV